MAAKEAILINRSHQPSREGNLLKKGDAACGNAGGPIINGFIKCVGKDGGKEEDGW